MVSFRGALASAFFLMFLPGGALATIEAPGATTVDLPLANDVSAMALPAADFGPCERNCRNEFDACRQDTDTDVCEILYNICMKKCEVASLLDVGSAAAPQMAVAAVVLPGGDCPRDCRAEYEQCMDDGHDIDYCENVYKACFAYCNAYDDNPPNPQCEMQCELMHDACIVAGGSPTECALVRAACLLTCLVPDIVLTQAALSNDPFLGLPSPGCPLKAALPGPTAITSA